MTQKKVGSEMPRGEPTPSPFRRSSTRAKAGEAVRAVTAEATAAFFSEEALHTTAVLRTATRTGAAFTAAVLFCTRVLRARAGRPTALKEATACIFGVCVCGGGGGWRVVGGGVVPM